MYFHLSDEQAAIQDAVRRTLADGWPMERLHAFADGDADFDTASWEALMALGIGGIALPEEHGGAGLGLLDAALVCEVVGEAVAPGPVIGQILTAMAIAASDNAEVLAQLPPLARGEAVATLAMGSQLVQSANAATLFLADAEDGGLRLIEAGDGVEIATVTATDRSRPVSRVTFADVKSHHLCGGSDPLAARIRDAALVLIAADALGGAQHVTDLSVAYAKERGQFGQPIGRFQGLKHQLAHMALDVEPARARWCGMPPMPGTRSCPMPRAPQRWPRRICARSTPAAPAPRSPRTAGSAILGNTVSTTGSAARSMTGRGWAVPRTIASAPQQWRVGSVRRPDAAVDVRADEHRVVDPAGGRLLRRRGDRRVAGRHRDSAG